MEGTGPTLHVDVSVAASRPEGEYDLSLLQVLYHDDGDR